MSFCSCVKEIKNMKKKQWLLEQNEHKTEQGWVKFLQQKDLLVWRRPLNENGLYQYKGIMSNVWSYMHIHTYLSGYNLWNNGLNHHESHYSNVWSEKQFID
jgi:hypothetical protein